MGVSTYTYVGPYIEAVSATLIEECTVRTCSNVNCRVHNKKKNCDGKFCSECGAPVAPLTYKHENQRLLGWYDVVNVLHDENQDLLSLYDEGEFYEVELGCTRSAWLMQSDSGKVPYFNTEVCENEVFDFIPEHEKAIDLFYQKYAPILNYIEERFGIVLSVKYGIVTYFI